MAGYYFDKKLEMKYYIHVKKVFLKITKKNDKKMMYKNTEIPNPRI